MLFFNHIAPVYMPLSCSEGFTELGYYNGTVTQTDSGAPCLKWTEFPDYVMQYPGRGLGDHSFCRNPDRESNPWCFFRQNSGAIGWAYCDCHQGAVRLVGGTSHSGRVEVYLNGQWGAVCDSHWKHRDASVVCRQLRSDSGSSESGPALFHFERLGCRGDEDGVSACRSRTFVTGDCSHGNEAAVLCAPPEGDGPPLRLVGGEEDFEGRVEVFHGGKWGSICDDQWDDRDAEVVCRQLGFSGVAKAWSWAHFGQGSGPIFLDAVKCSGNELFLDQCHHGDWEQHNCDHMEDAGVSCSPYTDSDVCFVWLRWCGAPGRGDTPWEGRVEVLHNGDWGTICDDHWTQQHAEVVCRQLGYRYSNGAFGEGVGLILLDDVRCDGAETSLLDCPHGIWGRTDCSHSEDVGVRCRGRSSPLVRLAGGRSRTEGRVEVYLHGDWGGICDSGWNDLNAAVVCRQLGHSGRAVVASGFGQSKGPTHLDQVRCTGKEEFLGECPSLGQSTQGCRRRQDAGVRCDVDPQEAVQSQDGVQSCGLRKLEGNTNTGEGNIIRNTWPWQVSVWRQSPDGLTPLCSGTLVSSCWALTSASCLTRAIPHSSRLLVRVGSTVQTLIPKQVVVHRKFKGQRGRHDLALVRLLSPKGSCMPLDPNSNAACLPSAADRGMQSSCVVTVTAAWSSPGRFCEGHHQQPVFATWVPLMSSWQCKKQFGDHFSSHDAICAGSPPNTTRVHGEGCDSSSGGGLVCLDDSGHWVLAGVVAGGSGCNEPSSPATYTRVGRFRSWIDEVINVQAREEEEEEENGANDFTAEDVTMDHDETQANEIQFKRHPHGKSAHSHHKHRTNGNAEV
uniref:Si:ch73-127m5.1 n=1 Tax=Neogobius melanostomus TaxID=47308 RepID=A0A8C6UST9_9GOBI